MVELLVEAVDRLLVVERRPWLHSQFGQRSSPPSASRGLLPLDRVDEALVALGADVQVEELAMRAGRLRAVRRLVLEVDDLDRTTGGEDTRRT